ncbi:hypothetical protein DL95DRAFT_397414, partial [Leptodontidium sp. 2 PMI_412]
MSSSFLNLTNYYSPPGATLPAAASTPQPIPQNEQIDFNYGMDIRHQEQTHSAMDHQVYRNRWR